ncbi:helix-turn-helix domain-containing protein [Streptomyces sp. SD11]|uniref:helix-turn-helix domain-containing protein n=1 Tax=Streptomyces sp. SD11 TaxID=3452209 RepID=UPI003F8B7060
MRTVRDGGDTRTARTAKPKEDGPDLPGAWSAYGVLLRHLRKRAGLNQQQLGDAIGYSLEQVASVEQGRRPAKVAFTAAADRALEAGGVLEVLQEEVDRAKLPRFFRNFALIEAGAVSRFEYEPLLVPGLLQTEEYVRAVYAGHRPKLERDVVDNHTEARLNRQRILTRAPAVDLSFVIAETALTNSVGGAEVMRGQLHHLLAVGELENVQLQIMPPAHDFHLGLNGSFVVLETGENQRFGYVESQGVGVVVAEVGAASHLGLRYGMLRSQALNTEQSARLIERLAGETAT